MPSPIPRNRSAGGPQPRRSARHRAAPGLPFRRPQENNRQPGPPPRPITRHRASAALPFRRLRENIRQLGLPPIPARARNGVMAGVLLCIVAAFVVAIVLPLLPWKTSSGSTAAPPGSDSADVAATDRDDPGPAGGILAAGPDASAGLDRGSLPEDGTHSGLSEVPRGVGFLVPGTQPGPAAQPAPPSGPAKVADPGQQGDPPAVGQPGHAEPVRRPEPQAPPHQPQVPPVPEPTPSGPKPPDPKPSGPHPPDPIPSHERLKQVANQLAKLRLDRTGDADLGPRPQPHQAGPGRNHPKVTVRRPADKATSPRQASKTQPSASVPKHGNSGSNAASPRSGTSGVKSD